MSKSRVATFALGLALSASALGATAPGVTPPVPVPHAPAEIPSATAVPDAYSKQPIQYENTSSTTPGSKDSTTQVPSTGMDPFRVTIALGGVLGLIFLLRWGMKKVIPGAVGHRGTRAIKVLSRTMISPRQHLMLIQVGRRLVVIGEAGSQLNPLCEITDPAEVSALLLQVGEENTSVASRFTSIFTKAKKDFDPEAEVEKMQEPNRDIAGEVQEESEDEEAVAPVDPTIDATRQELAGLSDKVRNLVRNLGRG